MNVGDTVILIGAASDCSHLIGRRGVVVPDPIPDRWAYIYVRVEGLQHLGKDTFLFKHSELRLLSPLEQLAGAGDE